MVRPESAVEVVELRKTFRSGYEALHGVTFRVGRGEIFGLLGPNGAGKTTTVRILATLSRATSGSALVDGVDVGQRPGEVRRRIGYVAQTAALDFLATGRENLLLQGRLFGLSGARLKERIAELVTLFQLEKAIDRFINEYSGGTRRRLDLAMGLIHVPAVLFLDEPTTGLDPENRRRVWEHIRGLAAHDGIAILLTTHYMEEADTLAARLAIIDQGRIVVEGTPGSLKSALEGDVVSVELGSAEPVPVARELIERLEGVTRVMADTTTLFAQVPDGGMAVPLIVAALRERQIPLARISLKRPTLDEVYLSATGHQYQPGAAWHPRPS